MKNLNRYKDIFSSKEKLSAKDIEQYNSLSQQEKNAIEQKEMGDSFDQDAMEGWASISHDTSILSKTKNPFLPSKPYLVAKIILSVLIGAVSTYLILSYNGIEKNEKALHVAAEKHKTKRNVKEIIIESNDVILPKEIEILSKKPIDEQISVAEIKNDFHQIEEINANLAIAVPHQMSSNESTELILPKKKAQEIYLHDLKLVDYNQYRNESFIKTKQFVLTGTPANLEDENSDSYQTEWKTIQQDYTLYLENTMYYFNSGKYKKALYRFETILKKYPEDVNANFYSGLCFFNFGEYSQAIERFSKCTMGNFNNFDEESLWMIANSYKNLGNETKAEELFNKIIKSNGFYATQAEDELKKMN